MANRKDLEERRAACQEQWRDVLEWSRLTWKTAAFFARELEGRALPTLDANEDSRLKANVAKAVRTGDLQKTKAAIWAWQRAWHAATEGKG